MTAAMQLQATDSLEMWLSYLEQSHFKPIDMGLERIREVAEKLNLLKPAPYVITVAGTNGKGSTCKLLETALLKAGYRVGVYASPHLIRYNERVRIDGKMVTDSALTHTFAQIEKNKSQSLTYFEFGTLAALSLFQQEKVDIAILEVGLGGRLDATNIVDPNFAVITSIDIDHIQFLGDNRELIGREKAGIFRQNIPVVIGEPDCPQSILDEAEQWQCYAFRRGKDWDFRVEQNKFHWNDETFPLPHIPYPNCATAIAVLKQLPFEIPQSVIGEAISATQMLGRFQTLSEQDFAHFSQKRPLAQVIVDVGHNPHAARYLAIRLAELKQPNRNIYAVFSALADKDLAGMVQPLENVIDQWHCAGLSGYRGQSGEKVAEKLIAQLPYANVTAYDTVPNAAQVLFERATAQDIMIVFGSFHTVADFMLWLE